MRIPLQVVNHNSSKTSYSLFICLSGTDEFRLHRKQALFCTDAKITKCFVKKVTLPASSTNCLKNHCSCCFRNLNVVVCHTTTHYFAQLRLEISPCLDVVTLRRLFT
ncbi:hypothetical protein TNCT_149111 [Trichonephila clavata]|uniref:Uncharacterized protein n=1 Tax=Trichonephila clavata TaxID=2740835 RepID=A0A8X6L6C9_TRICU|nr:hypothetical protein TNCT_149111 [Trichonephila clavata]